MSDARAFGLALLRQHALIAAEPVPANGAGIAVDDPATGEERCRIEVTLATGIDAGTTGDLALSYLDPATIDVEEWSRDPETLVVPDAGEILYRLR